MVVNTLKSIFQGANYYQPGNINCNLKHKNIGGGKKNNQSPFGSVLIKKFKPSG